MAFFQVNETVNVLYAGLWHTATVLAINKDKFTVKLSDDKKNNESISVRIGQYISIKNFFQWYII
jgi:hypothetical protein